MINIRRHRPGVTWGPSIALNCENGTLGSATTESHQKVLILQRNYSISTTSRHGSHHIFTREIARWQRRQPWPKHAKCKVELRSRRQNVNRDRIHVSHHRNLKNTWELYAQTSRVFQTMICHVIRSVAVGFSPRNELRMCTNSSRECHTIITSTRMRHKFHSSAYKKSKILFKRWIFVITKYWAYIFLSKHGILLRIIILCYVSDQF